MFVYPSFYEGFGIPILEALNSRVPVITTRGGVFPETGGDACIYVEPESTDEMLHALETVLGDGRRPTGCACAVQPMPAISANRSLHPT